MKKWIIPLLLVVAAGGYKWWFDDTLVDRASGISFSYLVKYSAYAQEHETLPLLIALHGNGDTPENYHDTALDEFLEPFRIIVIRAPISGTLSFLGGRYWPEGQALKTYGDALASVIAELQLRYPTQGKPLLMGYSGGGMMAYYLAVAHPRQFSYLFPISGKLKAEWVKNEIIDKTGGLQVFGFHGKADKVIFVSEGKNAVAVLQEKGIAVQLHLFEGDHLGVFTSMKTEISRLIDSKVRIVAEE